MNLIRNRKMQKSAPFRIFNVLSETSRERTDYHLSPSGR
jgi:hypothetical protein